MKYLTIILVVLTIGFGLNLWTFDLSGRGGGQVAIASSGNGEKSDPNTGNADKSVDSSAASLPDDTVSDSNDVNADNSKTKNANASENTSSSNAENPDDASSNEDSSTNKVESEPEDPNDPLVAINLSNVEMKKLLDKLADWTDKVIIPSDEAMKVKITIYAAKKVPQSQALNLIFDALRAKGIIAEISENKLFLKPIAEAKLGYVPVLSEKDPLARVEDKSQIVEKYFKLENASPSKLSTVITPITASYGHVTAYENTNSISVIDTVENLIRIEKTIKQFDAPDSNQVKEQIFEIKQGDPAEIVQVLELILNSQSSGSTRRNSRSRPRRSSSRGRNEISPATSTVIDSGETPIVLLPIPRHNWIIARASAEDLKEISSWIERLDIKESVPPEQTIIPVNYVDPYEVSRLVRNTIQEMPGSELKASVVVEPMRNSKQIVVFGSEDNRKLVEKLIAEIDVPTDDNFKTIVFKLKHADPDEIKSNLEGLYDTEAGSYSSYSYQGGRRSSSYRTVDPSDVVKIISFPSMDQVTVIASEENIKKISEQIKEWDVPMDLKEDQYRLISLKNSDPVQLAELLGELFSEDSGSSSGSIWDMIYGRGNSSDEKKKIVGSLYGLLTFKPVPGTKKILVISQVPEAYDVIEKLIKDLDKQEEGEVPKVITLNYADAEELCDQLNAILNESGSRATLFRREQGLSETNFNSTDGNNSGSSINQQQNNNNPDEIVPWWNSTRRDDSEMPISNLIGKIRFVPVHRSKAILVLSPPEYLEEIEKMIAKLDEPGKQVMIEAVIVEVDHATMTSLGVKLANGKFEGDLGTNAVAALTDVAYGREFSNGFTLENSLSVSALVDLLARTVNAKILNQPNLWTKDNEEAVFFKGREISLESSNQSYATSNATSRTEYKQVKVGVTLQVRPSITPENDVDTKINLEISDVANGTVNNQPVINKLNTTTKLIVADGETIMLGGILFQNESIINSKVPLLSDIPIAGGLFNHDEKELRNNELLVFITPHVVDGKDRAETEKYIKSPLKKLDSVKNSLSGDSEAVNGTGSFSESPMQRMENIRGSLNSVMSEGLFEK